MVKKSIYCILLLLSALFLANRQTCAASKDKPNVILIYADGFGKGLLSAYGQKHFTTPNIDGLVNNGVSFDYAYGGAASAYSRASLLTGYMDNSKNRWRITNGGVYMKEDTTHLHQNEDFIDGNSILLPENDLYLPQVFRKAGYVTGEIGVLEWGNTSSRRQLAQHGWDYYFGYLDHIRSRGYYPPFLFENGQIVMLEGNTRLDCGVNYEPENENAYNRRWDMKGKEVYAPALFVDKIIEFMREFKDSPFFLMYGTPLPGPVSIPEIHPEVANNESLTRIEKEYASMVKLLDDNVGKIMSELRSLGLEENTIVIFTSDCGHEIYYLQDGRIEKPYRNIKTGEQFDNSYYKFYSDKGGDVFNGNAGLAGLKSSNLEGGINVPLIFYRKGALNKGVRSEFVANYDFLPTMADLLNVKLQAGKDGLSYLPALTKGSKLPKNRYIVISSEEGPVIITNEGWKLRFHRRKNKYELYNLRKDKEEKYDVILRFPEKAEELKNILLKKCYDNVDNGSIL